jgi:hypothetical protein
LSHFLQDIFTNKQGTRPVSKEAHKTFSQRIVTSTRELGLGLLNKSLLIDGKPVFQKGLMAEYRYPSWTHRV